MGPRAQKLESERTSRVRTEPSDPPQGTVDLEHTTSQSTHHLEPEEHSPDGNGWATDPNFHFAQLERQTVDDSQPPSAQSGSNIDNCTAEELFARQQTSNDNLIEVYRTAAIQERFQLAQTVQSEIQAGMNQITRYIKNALVWPTGPSTSAEVENLKKQLKAEKTHNKDLISHYNSLVKTTDHQMQELQKVKAKLKDALQEKDQLRKLLDCGNLVNSEKLTDDAIKSKWAETAYNIKCMAHTLGDVGSVQLLDDEVTKRLRFVSSNYRRHLLDPDLRDLLIQSYLWVLVQDEVFETINGLWGGPNLGFYKYAHDSLIDRCGEMEADSKTEPFVANIARWLAQGSTMMNKMWDKDNIAITRMVHNETKRLQPFMADVQSRTNRIEKKISNYLSAIINSAIELDQMMMCSKAIFQIHWRDQSQNPGNLESWNPDVMKIEAWERELSPKSRVLFHISPILYKTGTADGQRYDSKMILAKSTVVCN